MTSPSNYYDWLEVPLEASTRDIKAAYRRLVRQYHPDLPTGNAERFKQINEAYQVLSQESSRKLYNLKLGLALAPSTNKTTVTSASQQTNQAATHGRQSAQQAEASKHEGTRTSPSHGSASAKAYSSKAADGLDNLKQWVNQWRKNAQAFEAKAEGVNTRETATGAHRTDEQQTKNASTDSINEKAVSKGADIVLETWLSPQEARQGLVKTLVIESSHTCRACASTGKINGKICNKCDGQGSLRVQKNLEVQIPATVKDGSKVRVRDEGHVGSDGKAGDLYLVIKLHKHDAAFRTEGSSVYLDWQIDIPTAVLGGSITVPTQHGEGQLVLPAGTQHGQVFRLKGQGLRQGQHVGDQFVKIAISIPKKVSTQEAVLYQAIRRLKQN